jgi:ribosomal protein L40E
MSNTYWFQVGAYGASENGYGDQFGQTITGASVEIRILDQKLNHADTEDSYWVGVNLPNDAFIQAGYMEYPQYNSAHPSLFWEYFLPGTADENTGGFLGNEGQTAGMNGTWVKFSVTSTGTIWSAYANDQQLGQIDLSVGDSGGSGPYAVAESAQTYWADNVLGPVEFSNLSYRDSTGVWHQASAGVSLCCYGVTSANYTGAFLYGVESIPGENNHWLAGSGLPYTPEGQYLWPWYYVTVESSVGSPTGSGWYVEDSQITPQAQKTVPITAGERYNLKGWTDGTNTGSGFTVDNNMSLTAMYTKQYLVSLTSPLGSTYGSGWHDAGSVADIGVKPTSIPADGILGVLGVRSTFSGWEGNYTGTPRSDGSSLITVNAPMMVQAEWQMNLGTILPASAVIIMAAVVSVTAVALRRRSKVQFCLNCGQKLPSGSTFCLGCGHRQEEPK